MISASQASPVGSEDHELFFTDRLDDPELVFSDPFGHCRNRGAV
jgi:hypothetical protein